MIETKKYSDGTMATGTAPLPVLSQRQQDARDALLSLDDLEAFMGGSNGPSIRLRSLVYGLIQENHVKHSAPNIGEPDTVSLAIAGHSTEYINGFEDGWESAKDAAHNVQAQGRCAALYRAASLGAQC